jgi:Tol biopolymer transport system component
VVLVSQPNDPRRVRVLSRGLVAAGGPVLSSCGERVLFSGKAKGEATWQVYEARLRGGEPRQLTTATGGAMDPAYLPDGRIVFSSPVPAVGELGGVRGAPVLYAQQLAGGRAEPLTFGLAGAMSSTVLGDGRILFVSGGSAATTVTNLSLFTINNDGTELTGYAGQHQGGVQIWRPRELPDGRVVFLSADWGGAPVEGRVEQVFAARPYSSRAPAMGEQSLVPFDRLNRE